MGRKGQIDIAFNWIYVLVAGAAILLFFAWIVVQEKKIAEEELTADVVRVVEKIFTGATVSQKTKNLIDASGLSDYTLFFTCKDGLSEYGIQGGSYNAQNSIDPFFSPSEIKSTQLVAWSMPYNFPFKVLDLLFVTAPNVKYYVFGFDPLLDNFVKEMGEVKNVVRLETPDAYSRIDPEKNYHLRLVTDASLDLLQRGVPPKFQNLPDEQASAVVLAGSRVLYYQKRGNSWQQMGQVDIISLGGDRDPATFAALFAGTYEQYTCNMQKAFHRLEYVGKLYQKKVEDLSTYYTSKGEPSGTCMSLLAHNPSNVQQVLQHLVESAHSCQLAGACSDLIPAAQELQRLNQELGQNCLTLY